jgi:6-phosphogluconolactonase
MIKSDVIYTGNLVKFGSVIAREIIRIAQNNIAEKGSFFMATSGGSTPIPVFAELRKEKYLKLLDWSKMYLFFIDERCVPIDHDDNNYKFCYDNWLKYNPDINCSRIESWLDPREAAKNYELKIESILDNNNGIPQFDLIFMGMGEDGHIASLFPEYNFGMNNNRLVDNLFVKALNKNRISMMLPIIKNAQCRIIGILGKKKKRIFKGLGTKEYAYYPVSQMLTANGKNTWVIN